MKYKGILYIITLIFLVSCEPNLSEDYNYSKGNADFTTYVAIGNSLTTGFANAALYKSGQENSFPNILAQQLKLVGGGDFKQPLISTEEGVGITIVQGIPYYPSKLKLGLEENTDCQGQGTGEYSLKPVYVDPNPNQAQQLAYLFGNELVEGPYNNVGVPGALIQHLLFDKYGNPTAFDPNTGAPLFNPYFVRFASSPSTTVIADAIAKNPTFFTLWIGNNDILGSAMAGTDAAITPPEVFAGAYGVILQSMFGANANLEGVLINIPEIHSIPFFTTVSKALPWNGLVLDEMQAAGLTQLYALYGHPEITFQAGPNAFVVEEADGTYSRTKEGDLFLLTLPTKKILCEGLGSANPQDTTLNPIPGSFVLNISEQEGIQSAIEAYNSSIETLAAQYDIAVMDAHSIMNEMKSGITVNGLTLSTTFVEGGSFSLDGVHLNPLGFALLTNYLIGVINDHYDANIPEVVVTNYNGIEFP
ncbi:MAG: hypothetical protein U5Q03_06690 [Bacteroidota bacterium]|nr:hypothetical protein [Bacteroidota bacterium]